MNINPELKVEMIAKVMQKLTSAERAELTKHMGI